MKLQNALTVAQLAALNPAISESTIRWWIFKAEEFGFSKCIIRFRRPGQARGRILIDLDVFEEWLEEHRDEQLELL